jgi:hypothetical protein
MRHPPHPLQRAGSVVAGRSDGARLWSRNETPEPSPEVCREVVYQQLKSLPRSLRGRTKQDGKPSCQPHRGVPSGFGTSLQSPRPPTNKHNGAFVTCPALLMTTKVSSIARMPGGSSIRKAYAHPSGWILMCARSRFTGFPEKAVNARSAIRRISASLSSGPQCSANDNWVELLRQHPYVRRTQPARSAPASAPPRRASIS